MLNFKHNLVYLIVENLHVLGLLYVLLSLAPAQFQTTSLTIDDVIPPLPITPYICKWKIPRKRKESNLKMSEMHIEKHLYGHECKKNLDLLEDFDPRPLDCKG